MIPFTPDERRAQFAPSQVGSNTVADHVRSIIGASTTPTMDQQVDYAPPIDASVRSNVQTILARQQSALMSSLMNASRIDPDKAAEAQRLGQQVGVGQDIALRNMDELRQRAFMSEMQQRDLENTNPILAQYLKNREFASQASDDIGVLSNIENIMRPFREEIERIVPDTYQPIGLTPSSPLFSPSLVFPPLMLLPNPIDIGAVGTELQKGFRRGRLIGQRGHIGTLAALGIEGGDLNRAAALQKEMQELGRLGMLGTSAEMLGQMREMMREMMTGLVIGAEVGTVFGPKGTAIGGSIGLQSGMVFGVAKMEAGNLYADMVADGVSPEIARNTALVGGFINGLIELASFKIFAKPFKSLTSKFLKEGVHEALRKTTARSAVTAAAKSYGLQVGANAGQEALQEVVAIVTEEVARAADGLDPKTSASEASNRILESAVYGAAGASILGSIGPGANLVYDINRANQTIKYNDSFAALARNGKDAKLAIRNPPLLQRFLRSQVKGTRLENLFIDATTAQSVLSQAGVTASQIDAVIPGFSQQLAEAAAVDGAVIIPTEQYISQLDGTAIGDALSPHIRASADGLNLTEARTLLREQQELLKEANKLLAQQSAAESAFVEEANAIKDQMVAALKEAGRSELEANAEAALYQAIVVTQASAAKMTPMQWVQLHGLRQINEVSLNKTESILEQADQFTPEGERRTDTPEFKAWSNNAPMVQGDAAEFATGQPFVGRAYHGSPVPNITAFEPLAPSRFRKESERGMGAIWFGAESATANFFASKGSVYPVYVTLQNPLIVDAATEAQPDLYVRLPSGQTIYSIEYIKASAIARAKREGHDGVVFVNAYDGPPVSGKATIYAIFNQVNIKSVNNRGTWSRGTANILEQVSPEIISQLTDDEVRQVLDYAYEVGAVQSDIDALETELDRREVEEDDPSGGDDELTRSNTGLGIEELMRQAARQGRIDQLSPEQLGASIRRDGDFAVMAQAKPIADVSDADLGQEAYDALDAHEQRINAIRARIAARTRIAPNILEQTARIDAEYMAAVERGDMETAQRMVDEAADAQRQATQNTKHPVGARWRDVLLAIGATLTGERDALTTRSDYATVTLGRRTVTVRGSDHHNFHNPRTAETARNAVVLRYTAPGFERAFALWLGFSEEQLRGLNLNTKRDLRALATMKPAVVTEQIRDPVTYDEAGNIVPLSRRFDITSSRIFEQAAMSTRVPTAKGMEMAALDSMLLANWDAMKDSDKLIAGNLAKIKELGFPVKLDETKTPREQLEQFIDAVADNIDYLYEQMNPEQRERAKVWYVGAHRIANWLAARYGITVMQAAGMLAVLSPQKNWFENVSMADRIGDILTAARNERWSPEMEKNFRRMVEDVRSRIAITKRQIAENEKPVRPTKPRTEESLENFKARKKAFDARRSSLKAKYERDLEQWNQQLEEYERELEGLLEAGESTTLIRADMAAHRRDRPKSPRMPGRILAESATEFEERKKQYQDDLAEWKERGVRLAKVLQSKQQKIEYLDQLSASARMQAMREGTLQTVLDAKDLELAAMFVRMFDEEHNDRTFAIITPEGGMAGPSMKEGASGPMSLRWGAYSTIQKAISIFEDGRAENVHHQIGKAHKVRNFYNNIFDPTNPNAATIDTHAIAASALMPLSASDDIVGWGLGAGVSDAKLGLHGGYPIVFEAYRRAAERRGIIAREEQSITWEAIRGLFVAAEKKTLKPIIAKVWGRYMNGDISLDEARAQVFTLSNGIKTPEWVGQSASLAVGSTYSGRSRSLMDAMEPAIKRQMQKMTRVSFEIAPDLRNEKLTAAWQALPVETRYAISRDVMSKIVPKILKELEITAAIEEQIGGREGGTELSFAMSLPSTTMVRQVSRALRYVLQQKAIFSISDEKFEGSELAGMVVINLQPGTTPAQIKELYEKRLYKVTKLGHSTVGSSMIIGLEKGVDSGAIARRIAQSLVNDPLIIDIEHGEAWSLNDVSQQQSIEGAAIDEGAIAPADQRRRLDAFRAEATELIANELRGAGLFKQAARDTSANRFDQAPVGPTFYSALEREVTAIDAKALTAADWGNRFKGLISKGAIKADELEWSGLSDYLKMQEGKVSKDAVLEFLRGNGVTVKQVTLGDRQEAVKQAAIAGSFVAENQLRESDDGLSPEIETAFNTYRTLIETSASRERIAEQQLIINDALDNAFGTDLDYYIESEYEARPETKYQQYTLPGGTNYREILLTLPTTMPAVSREGLDARQEVFAKYAPRLAELEREISFLMFAGVALTAEEAQRLADARNERDKIEEQRNAEANAAYKIPESPAEPEYRTPHWDKPNVLVHLRMNDRVDADGKRVLFVEEVQSDWGQTGRKKGFATPLLQTLPEGTVVYEKGQHPNEPNVAVVELPSSIGGRSFFYGETVEEATANALAFTKPGSVARAPFVETTDGWLNLGLKQVLLEAMRGNYDRVAFVNGKQSAERYDLSKQVSLVSVNKQADGRFLTYLEGVDGTALIRNRDGFSDAGQKVMTAEELEATVGKEVALQLIEGKPNKDGWVDVRGDNLRVGGKGIEAFYDKIVPAAMNKLLKKYGGLRIGPVELEGMANIPKYDILNTGSRWQLIDRASGERVSNSPTFRSGAEAEQWIATNTNTVQLGFDITSEMRNKLESGLPLFQASQSSPRGGFDPKKLLLLLTKSQDSSTVIHELAHFLLVSYSDMARNGTASPEMLADLDELLRWRNIAGDTPQQRLATWLGMSLDQQRTALHEPLAYSFEVYVMEGKAPTSQLQMVFDRLRLMMLRVYKTIRDDINRIYRNEFGEDLPMLTPEVRGVFDRMLASREEIQRQTAINNMKALFQTQAESGMSDQEWAAYQAMEQEAIEASVTDLTTASLRQMQWLGNARARVLRDLQRKHNAARREVASEIAAAVRVRPVYRAMTYLRYGKFIDADGQEIEVEGSHRLDLDAVRAMYNFLPEGQRPDTTALSRGRYGMIGKDGLNPDLLAEAFGYSSGDEMIRELLAARPMKDEIDAQTDAEMIRRYGDMNSAQAQEMAVQNALHSEARARFVAVELRFLSKAMQPVRLMLEAARQVAQGILADKRLRDIRYGDYVAGEARAARDAKTIVEDRAKRDTDAAKERAKALEQRYGSDANTQLVRAKRAQLYHNQLAKESMRIIEEIDAGIKYLRNVLRDTNVKRMGADAADQIAQLLQKYELAAVTLKLLDARQSLREYLAQQEAAGLVPDIAPEIVADANRVNYRELTMKQFRDLVDAVKQIEYIGKNQRKVQLAAQRAEYEQKRDEIVAQIREVGAQRGLSLDPRSPLTNIGRLIAAVRGFAAQHLKAASIAYILDGGRDNGPLWNLVIRTANAASDKETSMRAEASLALATILKPVFALGSMGGNGVYFESIGRSLNREARIAIALNMGNAGNIQRLLDGEGWTMDQVQPILESLTEAEWNAVQQVWDYINTYKPLIAEKERRLYGKEPNWVEPQPLTVKTADGKTVTLAGGYFPIKYDSVASDRVANIDEVAEAKRALDGAYTAATTRRSFTKARVREVVDRPLLYTLDAVFSGINDVIHDLNWHEWLIQTQRLLRDPVFANAVRETRGPEFLKQLRDWAKDNAAGERGASVAGEAALSWLRKGISAAGLGFNVISAALQITGFNQSIVKVGIRYVGRGIAQFVSSPIDTASVVADKSAFMRERSRTQFREINEIKNRVRGQTAVARRVTAGTYFLMMNMQRVVDIPTWLGAYQKALDGGKDDATAVALADQAVRDTQGSGLLSDLSAIERGGPVMKLFTVFYSYMNTVYNMVAMQTMTSRSKGKLAADYVMLLVVPVVLGYAIRNLLQPNVGDDEPDLEGLARKLAAEELSFLMGTMVIAREFGGAAQLLTGAEGVRMGYGGPAGLRAIGEVYGLATQAGQLEFDRAFRRSAINTLGAFTGLPSAQINRTIDGIEAIIEDEVEGVGAVVAPLTGVRKR